jgi:hypothetical protein
LHDSAREGAFPPLKLRTRRSGFGEHGSCDCVESAPTTSHTTSRMHRAYAFSGAEEVGWGICVRLIDCILAGARSQHGGGAPGSLLLHRLPPPPALRRLPFTRCPRACGIPPTLRLSHRTLDFALCRQKPCQILRCPVAVGACFACFARTCARAPAPCACAECGCGICGLTACMLRRRRRRRSSPFADRRASRACAGAWRAACSALRVPI